MAIAYPAYDPTTGRPVYSPHNGMPAMDCEEAETCPASVTVTFSGWTNGTRSTCADYDILNGAHSLSQITDCYHAVIACRDEEGACCYSWSGVAYQSPEVIDLCWHATDEKWYLHATDQCCLDIQAEMSGTEYDPTGSYSTTATECVTTSGTIVVS